MSATEKLKRIQAAIDGGSYRLDNSLISALPQIVVVVELAENFWGDATAPEEFIRALSALDEVLT